MKNMRGFTLIELLVVVAILGILSTMAMASFNSAQMKARDAQRRSDLSQIRSALELAKSDTLDGTYPNTNSVPTAGDFAGLKNYLENKGYMKSVPEDPKIGNYIYVPSVGAADYTLVACLENINDPKQDKDASGVNDEYDGCNLAGQVASVTFTAP